MTQWILIVILSACGAGFMVLSFLKPKSAIAPERAANAPSAHSHALADEVQDIASTITYPHPITGAEAPGAISAEPLRIGRSDRFFAAGLVAVTVVGAAGLYLALDQSGSQGQEFTSAGGVAAESGQPKLPGVDEMIGRVLERLKTNPNNPDDWRMVGWSYFETQHYPEAVDAYAHAVALQPQSAEFQSGYGEAQVLAAGGKVTPEALTAFKTALMQKPDDERALYYTGVAKRDAKNPKGAIGDWMVALKNAAPDSPWAVRLRTEIVEIAKAESIDISGQLPPPPPISVQTISAPSEEAIQQAQSMSPEAQQAMIKNMVAGLDERLTRNPRDRDGWIRLIKSREVLGETNLARDALDRALAAFRDDPGAQTALRAAAKDIGIIASR